MALLFNQAENNSQVTIKKMQQSLLKRGLEPVTFGVQAENEISQTVAKAARKGDLLLLPADNLMATAISLVVREALKMKRPLIVSDILLVPKGALAAQGADYSALGRATAEIAHRVLILDQHPAEVGILDPNQESVVVNADVLKALSITIPAELEVELVQSEGGDSEP